MLNCIQKPPTTKANSKSKYAIHGKLAINADFLWTNSSNNSMPDYRILDIDCNNQVLGRPKIMECADDEMALQEASISIEGFDVEVWQGGRLVARLPRY
jgi:hypothetical protein